MGCDCGMAEMVGPLELKLRHGIFSISILCSIDDIGCKSRVGRRKSKLNKITRPLTTLVPVVTEPRNTTETLLNSEGRICSCATECFEILDAEILERPHSDWPPPVL